MRKLQQAGSSKTVLTIVVICVAGLIATVVAIFIIVRFLEVRRRNRGDAAIQAGKSMGRDKRHKRRFSQTEYDDLPSIKSRKRRFSTGEHSDVWGNLIDATISEESTAVTTIEIDDKTYLKDDGTETRIDIIDDSKMKPGKIELCDRTRFFDKPPVPLELCDPQDLRDICNVADVPGEIHMSPMPILASDILRQRLLGNNQQISIPCPNKSLVCPSIILTNKPMLKASLSDESMAGIPPELTSSDLHFDEARVSWKTSNVLTPLTFDIDFPRSYPINVSESSNEAWSEAPDIEDV